MPSKPLTIWLLTDSKPGHQNQLRGLLSALQKQIAVEAHWLEISAWHQPLVGPVPNGKPDLILCCGHRTHIPALLCKLCYGGFLTVLMKPSLPLWLFNLCIIPEHDEPPNRKNIITTKGVLNTIEPSAASQQDPNRGLLLIGGPSKHHNWDNEQALQQIKNICEQWPETQWVLTTSRRTPSTFNETLTESLSRLSNLSFIPCEETGSNWLKEQFTKASQVWVSEDSVSMVYESLTSGAQVGLIRVPQKIAPQKNASSRVIRSIEQLIHENYLLTEISSTQEPNNNKKFPPQADIIAQQLLDSFNQTSD
ncbi:MAG: mitochondrial fission ELM1 family protein [Cellvibrionaceae bacterium]